VKMLHLHLIERRQLLISLWIWFNLLYNFQSIYLGSVYCIMHADLTTRSAIFSQDLSVLSFKLNGCYPQNILHFLKGFVIAAEHIIYEYYSERLHYTGLKCQDGALKLKRKSCAQHTCLVTRCSQRNVSICRNDWFADKMLVRKKCKKNMNNNVAVGCFKFAPQALIFISFYLLFNYFPWSRCYRALALFTL